MEVHMQDRLYSEEKMEKFNDIYYGDFCDVNDDIDT